MVRILAGAALVCALAVFSTRSASQGAWVEMRPMPSVWSSHAAAVLNDVVHVVGGGEWSVTTVHEVYDPVADSWTTRAPMAVARGHFGAAVLNDGFKDLLYVVGGSTGVGTRTASMEAYDPDTDRWTPKAPMPGGARSAMGAAVVNNRLYVVGGVQYDHDPAGITSLVEVYDPVLDKWLPNPHALPQPRYAMAVGAIGGILYVAGGSTGTSVPTAVYAYDPSNDTWTPKSSMSTGRLYVSSTVSHGRLWAIGGEAAAFFASVEVYDPVFDRWSPGPGLPAPRAEGVAVAVNGTIYVPGGFDGTTKVTTNLALVDVPVAPTPPTASLVALPNPAQCMQAVQFDASASRPGTIGRIARYDWDFGDGARESSVGAVQVHTYSRFGAYQANVTVTDDNVPALSGVAAVVVNVNQGDRPPQANPGGPYTVNGGGTVTFNGAGSSDPDVACGDSIASYAWTIDGSTHLSGVNPTLDTAAAGLGAGVHGVTLQVTDSLGATTAASTTLTIQRVLVSISVTPPDATMNALGHQQYTAIGHFSDGSTEVLSSSGSGGNYGDGGSPTMQAWWVHFFTGLPAGVCSSPQTSFAWSSQGLRNQGGSVEETWQAVQVAGTMTAGGVHLAVTCTDPSLGVAPGSITASWAGTRYLGSFDFAGVHGNLQITGWSRQAGAPTPRFAHGAATVNGLVYVVGGRHDAGLVSTVDVYDPAQNAWATLPPSASIPTPREGLGVAAAGGKIYAIGGRVADGTLSGIVEVFDPLAGTWTTLPAGEWMPTPRAHLAVVTDGTGIYAIGGDTQSANGGRVATLERYDPAAHTWTTLAGMPAPSSFIAAGVLNQTIVVIGSGDGGSSTRTDVYDIGTNGWHSGTSMPVPRRLMAAGVATGGLWVVGGSIDGAASFDTWVYYPPTATQPDRWTGSGAIPTARIGLAAAVVDDVVYATGGVAPGGGPSLTANEALSTVPLGDWNPGPAISVSSTVPAAQWQSTNPSVATVEQGGNATAMSVGTTRIIASAGGIQCRVENNECGSLTVLNTRPVVRIFTNVTTIDEGQQFAAGVDMFDPDAGQSWSATADYGDGTGPQPLTLSTINPGHNPTAHFTINHRYVHNGIYTVTVAVNDGSGGVGTATVTVTVRAVNHAPVCAAATPSTSLLWPPNHQWAAITINGVTDPDGDATAVTITGIFQDERVDGVADGDMAPDGAGAGTSIAQVRAERAGNPKIPGNGRVYHIFFNAADGKGGSCSGEVKVAVPRDQSAGSLPPIDDGALYNSITGAKRQ